MCCLDKVWINLIMFLIFDIFVFFILEMPKRTVGGVLLFAKTNQKTNGIFFEVFVLNFCESFDSTMWKCLPHGLGAFAAVTAHQ